MAEAERDAAALLADARRTGARIPALGADLRPRDIAAACAIQARTADLIGARTAGWKVALTPDGEVLAAPILAPLLFRSPARIAIEAVPLGGIEGEIALHVGCPLPPAPARGYALDDVAAIVEAAGAAIEVVDSRYTDGLASPPLDMLADFLSNGAVVVGAVSKDCDHGALAAPPVHLRINDDVAFAAAVPQPRPDPMIALAALANHLTTRGLSLESGDIVITGSHTGVLFAAAGDRIRLEFDGFPPVELHLFAGGDPAPGPGLR